MLDEPEIDTCKLSFVMAVKDALNVVNGKWKLPIVCALLLQGQRFSDLERLLGAVTPRSLSKDLKELELNGILTRRAVNETGRSGMVYELTDSGRNLEQLIFEMASWGQRHRQAIRDASQPSCPAVAVPER